MDALDVVGLVLLVLGSLAVFGALASFVLSGVEKAWSH